MYSRDPISCPLTIKDVPVDGFWSLTVYNSEGYLQPNPYQAYALNSLTAQKSPDGTINIQFGDCDDKTLTCLPITKGWNYTVRLSARERGDPERHMEIPRGGAGGLTCWPTGIRRSPGRNGRR